MKAVIDYTLLIAAKRREHEAKRNSSNLWLMIREPNGCYTYFKTY